MNTQPLRGFRDLYPEDKAKQQFIFDAVRSVAQLFGFEFYEGPIVEPKALYENKSSAELLEKQTFQVVGQVDTDKMILRPEMTPSLARMVAAKANELIFPLRYVNIGPRFRYEAPQKGRTREFTQIDFDLLGSDSVVADAEILLILVTFLNTLGLSEKDVTINLNSREIMQKQLKEAGVSDDKMQETLSEIDRMDKKEVSLPDNVRELITKKISPDEDPYYRSLFSLLRRYRIEQYFKINLGIVRGLDYYTGLVFEVKDNDGMKRSVLGGGRYNNLVVRYNPKADIQGVGFSVSDVILMEVLKNKSRFPVLKPKSTKVLVTVFDEKTLSNSIEVVTELRTNNIASELYPSSDKKLDKQLKYADRAQIPYVVIIGPEEMEKNMCKLKDLTTKEQKELSIEQLIQTLKN